MCGLSGYVGNTKADKHALRILLLDNESRGVHATGLANIEGELDKMAIEPHSYMSYDVFDQIADSKTVMCHNRWATMKNADEDKAAHPFRIDDRLIGAHNGFIPEWEYQAKKIGLDPKDVNVDSEIIFYHLVNNKYDPKCLSDIEGAMALSWIDLKTKILWLYRRSSRPLFIGEDSGKRLYYSSRERGLYMLGGRGNVELEENIAYGFKGGMLVKMIPIKAPKIYIPMDMGLAAFKWAIKPEEKVLLGIPKVKEYKDKKNKRMIYPPQSAHTRATDDPYKDYDEWYADLDRKSKPVSYDRNKILMGSLESLADITINDFNANSTHQLLPMDTINRVKNKNGTTSVVMKVTSSFDEKAVGAAVVFIDHPDADQYMTTRKGFVTMPIPEAKVGGFMRIGVLPYPYEELYHTSLLNLNEGEIMEVSLNIPFRSADREEAKKRKEELNKKKNSKSVESGASTDTSAKVISIDGGTEGKGKAVTQGSEDEPKCILDASGNPTRWVRGGGEDNETDAYVAEHYEQSDIGVHDQHGFLFKTVENEFVTICDVNCASIVDIPTQEFWSYAYEFRSISMYDYDFVEKYTDTLWGYMRFCGYTADELLAMKSIGKPITPNDAIVIEEIIKEAKDFKQL
jgi:hypothetical protein